MQSYITRAWTHHKARLDRAVDAKDYPAMRDASSVVRDLEARMNAAERQSVGLSPGAGQ